MRIQRGVYPLKLKRIVWYIRILFWVHPQFLVGFVLLVYFHLSVLCLLFWLSSSCVLFTQCCQCVWIVFILCLVYPMLSVCLDCLHPVSCLPSVVSVSGLSILDAPSVCSNVYNGVILQICNVYEPGSFTVNTVDIFRGGSRGGAPGARPP